MSPLDAQLAEQLHAQRKAAHRAVAQGRRWYLRAVLMMVIAVVSAMRGGQLYYVIGVGMVLLAGASVSMGHSLRKGGRATLEKIDLMEHTTSEALGELGG